jgi:hypothetical protein
MCSEAMFLADILGGCGNRDGDDNFSFSGGGSFGDNDAEGFSTTSLPKVTDETISDELDSRPTDDRLSIPPLAPPAFNVPSEIAMQNRRHSRCNLI